MHYISYSGDSTWEIVREAISSLSKEAYVVFPFNFRWELLQTCKKVILVIYTQVYECIYTHRYIFVYIHPYKLFTS